LKGLTVTISKPSSETSYPMHPRALKGYEDFDDSRFVGCLSSRICHDGYPKV
jgi:hypothetical protein